MNETRAYSYEAIFCGDSVDVDPHVNMTDVFKAMINGTQTISHMCMLLPEIVVIKHLTLLEQLPPSGPA